MPIVDPDTYWYLFLGVAMILGGCFCCLGCSNCTDWTDTSTILVDITGTTEEYDDAGCCTALDRSYILNQDAENPCRYEVIYENGTCLADECDDCDAFGCTGTCDEAISTHCNPASDPSFYCVDSGSTFHDINCTSCASVEHAVINYEVSTGLPGRCTCTCEPTGLIWDTDVMLADHPSVTWALPGDEVHYCSCIPKECTASNGFSTVSIGVEIFKSGSDTNLGISFSMLSRSGAITHTIIGSPISCITDINELLFSVGAAGSGENIEMTDCGPGVNCLCGIPSLISVSFLP